MIREKTSNSGRLAFRWDGINRIALQRFVGPYAQYRFLTNGDAIVTVGYGSLHLKPGHYIWDDSDGYDSGSPLKMEDQFEIVRNV